MKRIILFLLTICALFAGENKELIQVPTDQMQQLQLLQARATVLEKDAALVQAAKENLELQYALLVASIYERAGVRRGEYSAELAQGRLRKIDKKAQQEAIDKQREADERARKLVEGFKQDK